MPARHPVQRWNEAALLRGAVDHITAMLAYWDSSSRCRFANRAYERWFGVSPESLIGKHISELLGPTLYRLNLPYIEGALRGELQEFEREIPDPAGGPPRYSLANYIPDVVDGVVQGFYVLVTDISATKRALLALAESEARFSGVVAMAAEAIISVDGDQRITIFNAAAEKIFGYSKDEVLGRELVMLVPDRLRESHRSQIERFMASKLEEALPMGARGAIIGLRKNGDEFPAESAISKLDIGRGQIVTIVLRDISERRRLELEQFILAEAGAVLTSSLNYAETLKSVAALVVGHVADLCIVDMLGEDAEPERLTVAHAEPAKASACEALARISLPRSHPVVAKVLDRKEPQIFDDITEKFIDETALNEEHRRVLRELAPRSSMVVPLQAGDSVLGLLVFASSRPRQFGARDLEFATELAHRAAMAIENARLYEAARRATQARDDVLGIVAHDVRSPLNAIALAAELVGRKLENAELSGARENVESILRSVARANRLIEDLLDVTRIEAGVLGLTCTVVAVEPLLDEVLASQRLRASAASLELRREVESALPPVSADRDRLLQILENLIGNAIKFTPRNGRITVAATQRAGEVVFSVTDTGTGIPAASLPHVFDRFWQANRAERRGAGLGLPICKGIVEAHGGRLWVESTEGHGTSFYFTIPIAAANAAAARLLSA